MKESTYIAIAILFAIISIGCKSKSVVQEEQLRLQRLDDYAFDFYTVDSMVPILDKAIAEDKLVFLDLYTTWCLPCKLMDEDVFTNQELAEYFNKHFVSYKVDAEKANGPDLRTLFLAEGYPTLLFLDHKGRVLTRKTGVAYFTELRNLADEALKQNKLNNTPIE